MGESVEWKRTPVRPMTHFRSLPLTSAGQQEQHVPLLFYFTFLPEESRNENKRAPKKNKSVGRKEMRMKTSIPAGGLMTKTPKRK